MHEVYLLNFMATGFFTFLS